jgi:predicted amidohydrolase
MRIAVAQIDAGANKAANLRVIENCVEHAASSDAAIICFPEESMYSADEDADLGLTSEALDGPFAERLRALALQYQLAIVAGMHEHNGENNRPYNTLIVVDPSGDLLITYRKLHLYDALGYRESDRVSPGSDLPVTFEFGGVTFGLLNCYDIRFPELARVQAIEGAEVLIVCAAWMEGRLKEDHWRTLVRARAIENTCWVAASDQSGSHYVGGSMLVDPMGVVQCAAGDERPTVLIGEIDPERTLHVREALPVLENRRTLMTLDARIPVEIETPAS